MQPPNLLQFDHPSKRRRTSPARITGPSTTVPTIHLHLGDLPLNEQPGRRHINVMSHNMPSFTSHDSDDDDLIAYPSIEVLLRDLH